MELWRTPLDVEVSKQKVTIHERHARNVSGTMSDDGSAKTLYKKKKTTPSMTTSLSIATREPQPHRLRSGASIYGMA